MKISSIQIHGIKSYQDQIISMDDYVVFVGENNSGKSNIFFALLWFFRKEKVTKADLNSGISDDPFVEVEFKLSDGEQFPYPDKYLKDGKLKIRASVSRDNVSEKGILCEYSGYTEDGLLKGIPLLGLGTVAQASFGDVVYIPSIKALSEELKFTANSSMNQLVTKNVIARIRAEDEKMSHYNSVVESIENLSHFISTGENSAIQGLKRDIVDKMLDYGGINLDFTLKPPLIEDLIRSYFQPHIEVDGVDDKLPVSSQGDGFQRSMMFSLIANLAELTRKESVSKKSKSIKNKCTFYLIEEPEIFLHPNHQMYFRNKLEELSRNCDSQIILTSHSPYFLNHLDRYSQIKRVSKKSGISSVSWISDEETERICQSNGLLMVKAKNECSDQKRTNEQLQEDAGIIAAEDHLRYLLWIDPTRANAFLSRKVILVEGPTEKALFAFMFNDQQGDFFDEKETSIITVVDTIGKYHFFKFANLLYNFGIDVWCLYDTDNGKCSHGISHKILNENIEKLKEDRVIRDTFSFTPSLEDFIGLEKDRVKPDISLYSHLISNTNNCRESENYKRVVEFVRGIISA